jgi:PPP family 3-phenylpropionic acid transporter
VRGLRLLYLALGAGTAILNPFIIVILAEQGFGPAAIGLVGAIGSASLFAAAPMWGHIGDTLIGRRQTLILVETLATITAVGMGLPVIPVVLAGLVIVFTLSQGACMALCDSLSVSVLDDPRLQYGRIRMLSSLAFAFVSVPLGLLYDRTGYYLAGPLFIVGAALLFAALTRVPGTRPVRGARTAAGPKAVPAQRSTGGRRPLPTRRDGPVIKTASRLGSAGVAFQIQPRLFGVLASVLLVFFPVMISFTFLSLRIVSLGGQASDVALSFGVSALAEVPGMLLAARLAARLGLRGLFALGAVAFAAGFLSWTVLDSPSAIVATRVVTGLGYGSLVVAMVLTMGEILPGALQATGQTLYQAVATGLASVVGNLLGGVLYGSAGPAALFALCALSAAVGAALGWLTLPARVRRVSVPAVIEDVVRPNSPLV